MPLPRLSALILPHRRRSASTLAATMMVVLAIVTFLSISALMTSQFGRYAGQGGGDADLMTMSDSAHEYAYAQWRAAMKKAFTGVAAGTAPKASTISLDSSKVNAAYPGSGLVMVSMPSPAPGSTSTLTIQAVDQNGQNKLTDPLNPTDPTAVPPSSKTQNVPGYPGWTGTTYHYKVTATVAKIGYDKASGTWTGGTGYGAANRMSTSRYYQVTQVPLFQAAIFYENKLEIHPGAAMVVTGPVHSNSDIWARGFGLLKFSSPVSYVGTYNEIGDASVTHGWDGANGGYIPGVGYFGGVPLVTWNDNKTSDVSAAKATQLNQVSPIDPFAGASTSLPNGLHDIVAVPNNNPSPQVAYNNASLIITVNSALDNKDPNRVVITDGQGQSLGKKDNDAVMQALNQGATNTVYDQRESSNVTVTNLDMGQLAQATTGKANGGLKLPGTFTGTVFIRDASTVGKTAIRLQNGRNLGQDVTVASPGAVYIQGDFNTGGNNPNDVPSNVSNDDGSAAPQYPGYKRYASAVMADAVTILSNNWQDSNSGAPLASRTAVPTTVNTAILSGDVPSNLNGNQTASGGAHNFPRFLENWNNVNFTYWGSLVEAFRSQQFTGLWQTNNVYYWPNRKWNFDTNFLTNQPASWLTGIQFSRGRWQREPNPLN